MSTTTGSGPDAASARAAIAQVPAWYHSLELGPGLVTPGWFDLRPVADRLPWPDVRGKRCLDIGTSDGFFAFELERRGAAEVLATDIPGHAGWDWEPGKHEHGELYLTAVFGEDKSRGFRVARELLGSGVGFEAISVYDLTPERVGSFDVVVCGSLLLHLRDPLRALEAIGSVCRGRLLSTNQIDLGRSLVRRSTPLLRLEADRGQTQWWLPNAAGHRQMLKATGFAIERESQLYAVPYGPGHRPVSRRATAVARSLVRRAVLHNHGVPHHAILAHRIGEP